MLFITGKKFRLAISCLGSFLFSLILFSQEENLLMFEPIESRMSNKWVYSIAQDELGFIWIGTEDGLNRYDGYTFQSLRNSPENTNSLPANFVRDIAITSEDKYWLATSGGGLSLFSPKSMNFKNFAKDHGINFYFVSKIVPLKNEGISIVCDEGVFVYTKESETFKKINQGDSNSKISVSESTLWLSNHNTLFEYHLETNTVVAMHQFEEEITMLQSLQYGLLVATSTQLFYYADQTIVKEITTEETITYFSEKKDAKYVASKNNLYQLDLTDFTLQKKEISLNNSKINTLFTDKQGLLWMGTTHGLFKEKTFHKVLKKKPIPIHARRIIKQKDQLFIGGLNGLYSVTNSTQKKLLNKSILSIQDFNGEVWTGTRDGTIFTIKNDTVLDTIQLKNNTNNVRRILGLEKDKKDRVWAGSWDGIHVLNRKGEVLNFFELKNKLENTESKIIQLFIDSKDRMWIITAAYGLFLISDISQLNLDILEELPFKNYVHDINDINSITSDVLFTIDEDTNGTIWIGSDFGVMKFDEKNDNFIRLRDGEKLFDKKTMTLRSDQNNNLWISTISNGIYKYNLVDKSISNYTEEDGLASNAFLFSSGYYDASINALYFGSEAGVHQIDLNESLEIDYMLPPYISEINIQNEKKNISAFASPFTNNLNLLYTENDFSIRFSSLDYRYSHKIEYSYSLDDQTWRNTDMQTAYFSNIPYGNHTLKVKANYNYRESTKKEHVTTFNFRVNPPWYLSWWAYIFYFLLACSLLLIIYRLLLQQRLAKEEAKRTKEFDVVKSRMYANISHEFRTPLTIINGLSDSIIESQSIPSKNKIVDIRKSSNQLLHLVNQMLDLVSLDAKKLVPYYKNGDVVEFINECISFYTSYSDSKNQKIIFHSEIDELFMDIDDDKLQKIINNILSNAIKFTQEKGKITIVLKKLEDSKRISMSISDTGKGIPQEHIPFIFDRYYMTFDKENNLGNGIGMALTKELTELLEGNISLKSELNKGSTFTITLPIKNESKIQQSFEYNLPFTEQFADFVDADKTQLNPQNKYSILLVEDNKGVRDYLAELLKDQYLVHQANNGEKGLEIAKSKKIDFIISDVMMPVMDGFEFCKQIKNNLETSHLPFIMITAKVEMKDKVKGYNLGVDAYLNKPFNNHELLAIIKNLITKKAQQTAYYSQLLKLPEKESSYNQLDIDFIKKVQHFALNKDLKLSTDEISKKMFTSRSQLHRKIKALTGMSITEYFNHIRIEKSKELLENSSLTISEIAYEVGYQDISYFSKNFKKAYGFSPSSFRKELKN